MMVEVGLQTAAFTLMASLGACIKSCFVPKYRSVVWTNACPSHI